MMHSNPAKTERIHALDSLRAIMMMLGLVLHTALTYSVSEFGSAWTLKDASATNLSMDWLVYIIHIFRMPLFFIVAGFFGALLFYKRGARKMIKNRLERILYPFIVFLLLLWPAIKISFGYTAAVFAGVEEPLRSNLASMRDPGAFLPGGTFHLWFLYYLLMITLASFGIGLILKKSPSISQRIRDIFDPIIQYPFLKLIVFSVLTFMMLFFMNNAWVATSTGFVPNLKTFSFYSFFYIFGWVLYKSRQPLGQLMRYDWLFTILGIGLFTIKFMASDNLNTTVSMVINSLLVWLFSFGITGLFIRYGSKHSAIMRYVSDASYWYYLLHLPLTAILPGLFADWNVPALVKFMVVLSITVVVCQLTYHYLVRATFIGKFLNGRRYSKSLTPVNVEPGAVKAA